MHLIAVNLENPSETTSLEVGDDPVRIGRKPEHTPGEPVDLMRIFWNDRYISRNHCLASREGAELVVQRLPALPGRHAPNAFYTNVPSEQRSVLDEPLRLGAGQSFTIGAKGKTAFFWVESPDELDGLLHGFHEDKEQKRAAFEKRPSQGLQHYDQVQQLDDYSLRLQLKLLQRDLPEQVLSGWTNEIELYTRASVFLENSLPGQKGVSAAFVSVSSEDERATYRLLNPDPNRRADFRPSRTLLSQLDLENPTASDIHIWTSETDVGAFRAQSSLGRQIDWVAAIPVAPLDEKADIVHDDNGNPVYLYVETRHAADTAAAAFIPFLRLIASLVASLVSARERQRIQDQMSAYFSPALRAVLQEGDQAALEPAMVDTSVIFVDRRGHSRVLESARSDEEILDRLRENQEVVGAATQAVFDHDGVITDFAGDGLLALWGWPTWEEASRNHALRAVKAAEAIVRVLASHAEFEEEHHRVMSAVRIGISTGRLAVGRTGPEQQWHLSVFGSVANLGARLERIAKEFRVPILIAGETADRIRGTGYERLLRKLCFIRPAGFTQSYPVYELIVSKELGGSGASRRDVDTYEEALEEFVNRNWPGCIERLKSLPREDPASRWLLRKARRFESHPPEDDWEGDIASLSK